MTTEEQERQKSFTNCDSLMKSYGTFVFIKIFLFLAEESFPKTAKQFLITQYKAFLKLQ